MKEHINNLICALLNNHSSCTYFREQVNETTLSTSFHLSWAFVESLTSPTLIWVIQSYTCTHNHMSLEATVTFGGRRRKKEAHYNGTNATLCWQEVQWFQISAELKVHKNIRSTSYISNPHSSIWANMGLCFLRYIVSPLVTTDHWHHKWANCLLLTWKIIMFLQCCICHRGLYILI
jgi:hypothetical protein